MNIKQSFEKISIFQKFEIYIITIAFLVLINTLYTTYFIKTSDFKNNSTTFQKSKITTLKSKINKKTKTNIIKELDTISGKFNITITDSKYTKKNITLQFFGKFNDMINYLKYISIHFDIKNFNLENKEKKILITINFSIINYYNPKLKYTYISNIPNPSKYNKQHQKAIKPIPKLYAVVGQNILLNDKWQILNEEINGYKIIKINKNSIILKELKSNKNFTLKVYNDK